MAILVLLHMYIFQISQFFRNKNFHFSECCDLSRFCSFEGFFFQITSYKNKVCIFRNPYLNALLDNNGPSLDIP